jgi:hypothetical protein
MAPATTPLPTLLTDPAPTDAHEGALVAAIVGSAPTQGGMGGGMMGGGTPIYAALDGALRWASAYQSAHPYPAQQTVVVFVTDGEPNGCEDDFDLISLLASDAYAATGVTTYTIGLTGSNEADMQQVAAAGNGDSFFVNDGPMAAQDLVAALQAIQGSVLDCDFAIPVPTDGGMADPTRVRSVHVDDGCPADRVHPGSERRRLWYHAILVLRQPGGAFADPPLPRCLRHRARQPDRRHFDRHRLLDHRRTASLIPLSTPTLERGHRADQLASAGRHSRTNVSAVAELGMASGSAANPLPPVTTHPRNAKCARAGTRSSRPRAPFERAFLEFGAEFAQ